jgi:hypothetical protein
MPFLLILFCGIGMYVGVGIGYNAKIQGQPIHPSTHPHFTAWQQVAGLIVDGAVFFKARLQQQISGKRPAGGYEDIPDGHSEKPPPATGDEPAAVGTAEGNVPGESLSE